METFLTMLVKEVEKEDKVEAANFPGGRLSLVNWEHWNVCQFYTYSVKMGHHEWYGN